PRSTTKTTSEQHQLRWRQPHKPRVQDQGSSPVLGNWDALLMLALLAALSAVHPGTSHQPVAAPHEAATDQISSVSN
ncbi:hypothetical protein, partial [Dactylosporangium sp. NPDC051484]|uniref:hypothetical protein n=1 Tax=Dactylosporangium sp. NPDC051484 TaxID=3154942 RepID=UPI00344C61CA